ncbi:hypothetical protein EDEG_01641 [Edhazardia aedis USNM 41457]|uniref:Kinesin motor domain-containing protein n=1 Tax=Edhazardia aedis (strain USNM 41457) TaxID=1003232 RepID=J9DNG4_EDHAE|nr:hypothetical protein EDEG_01641 [Edhazardia aedis USNM 41457]|eukprot:EJW04065.1 hypothetical protein EDEG_01641 [Edhazardia aedis USNM 41457]
MRQVNIEQELIDKFNLIKQLTGKMEEALRQEKNSSDRLDNDENLDNNFSIDKKSKIAFYLKRLETLEKENNMLKKLLDEKNFDSCDENGFKNPFYIVNELKKENLRLKNLCADLQDKILKQEKILSSKNSYTSNVIELLEKVQRYEEKLQELNNNKAANSYLYERIRDLEKMIQEKENYVNVDAVKIQNDVKQEHEKEIINLKQIIEQKETRISEIFRGIVNLKEEKTVLEQHILSFNKQKELLEDEIAKIKGENEILKADIIAKDSEKLILKQEIKTLKKEMSEITGKISVLCRIKPSTTAMNEKLHLTATENTITIDKNIFTFDKIFLPSSTQQEIHNEASSLIESIFDGYNVCIFAYGQTGSGKTYTMEGTAKSLGIIPRSLQTIFENKQNLESKGYQVKITINIIEIYNETIRDLLGLNNQKCEIRHDKNLTKISNCKYVEVNEINEAVSTLKTATKNRSVGSTECNDRSSRSHSVFSCKIEIRNDVYKEYKVGILNLIDLAGSERLSESKAEGVRLKETQNINKSLSALGNVINAIIKKEAHIPFRSSKLTYYLQNFLNSQCRVMMIVNVAPDFNMLSETVCSLRFAQKVSECKLGKQTKNIIVEI